MLAVLTVSVAEAVALAEGLLVADALVPELEVPAPQAARITPKLTVMVITNDRFIVPCRDTDDGYVRGASSPLPPSRRCRRDSEA